MSDTASEQIFADFLNWLKNFHAAVMAEEAEGLRRLHDDDTAGYTAQMRKKAELLAGLAEEGRAHLQGLPGELRFNLALSLERFSASAATALRLNSVFYMSALLYPDEHKAGEADNLALCIERMEREGAAYRH